MSARDTMDKIRTIARPWKLDNWAKDERNFKHSFRDGCGVPWDHFDWVENKINKGIPDSYAIANNIVLWMEYKVIKPSKTLSNLHTVPVGVESYQAKWHVGHHKALGENPAVIGSIILARWQYLDRYCWWHGMMAKALENVPAEEAAKFGTQGNKEQFYQSIRRLFGIN